MDLMVLWESEKPYYKKVNKYLKKKIQSLLIENGIKAKVSKRVKDDISLRRKLLEKGNTKDAYDEICDKSGVRIELNFVDDLDKVAKIILSNFIEIKCEDKRKPTDPNWIGYQAIHIDIRIKDGEEIEERLKEIISEIQIKTLLQSAWSNNTHDLTYKTDVRIPPQINRKTNLLNAMIEIADNEFSSLVDKIDKIDEFSVFTLLFFLDDIFTGKIHIRNYHVNFTIFFLNSFFPYLNDKYGNKEFKEKFSDFVDSKIVTIRHCFDSRTPTENAVVFFKQPECILIFFLLNEDRYQFAEEWKKHFNIDDLETVASWFGISLD